MVGAEPYRDGDAGRAHVQSAHFRHAMATQGQYAARRPQVVSVEAPGEGWADLGEIAMPGQ